MGRVFSVFLLTIAIFGFFFLRSREEFSVASPLSKKSDNQKQVVKNTWFPKKTADVNYSDLALSAKSAILVDYDSGEVIYARNSGDKLPAASTIKIMTALVALAEGNLSDIYKVSERSNSVGENSMGLSAGEKLTLEELLYGLMLVSGNDAAVTIAEGTSGSEDEFVNLMNEYVSYLGLKNTRFVNATGLDDDNKAQFSSAYDMVTIAHYVWEKYPVFGKITSTYNKFIEGNEDHKAFDLYNDTNLLTTYPGVGGIKPGFTWEAGLCLVTYAENDGKKLLAVILGSDDRRGAMKELLDYGFASYGILVSHPALDL